MLNEVKTMFRNSLHKIEFKHRYFYVYLCNDKSSYNNKENTNTFIYYEFTHLIILEWLMCFVKCNI